MARMVPIHESRVRVTDTPDGLRVDLIRRRPLWRFIAPLWIAFIGVLGLTQMLSDQPPDDSGGRWFLVVWTVLALTMIALSFWSLLYRERLLLGTTTLVQTRTLGPIRLRRAY